MALTVTASTVPLGTCKGDWMQRGCHHKRQAVHNVDTHDTPRDVCAYHSPFDLGERYPAGSIIRYVTPAGFRRVQP